MPPWGLAGTDLTFGCRFDDPNGAYRVTYLCSSPLGCFLETLATFRPDPALLTELEVIEGPNDYLPSGHIPQSWLDNRFLGSAEHTGTLARVADSDWLAHLRPRLYPAIPFFDTSHLQSPDRRLTQQVSRLIHDDPRNLTGIAYRSRLGHDLENYAVFERVPITGTQHEISSEDPDLTKALQHLGLTLITV